VGYLQVLAEATVRDELLAAGWTEQLLSGVGALVVLQGGRRREALLADGAAVPVDAEVLSHVRFESTPRPHRAITYRARVLDRRAALAVLHLHAALSRSQRVNSLAKFLQRKRPKKCHHSRCITIATCRGSV